MALVKSITTAIVEFFTYVALIGTFLFVGIILMGLVE